MRERNGAVRLIVAALLGAVFLSLMAEWSYAAVLNVVNYGAKPNDSTDDTAAIEAAISASASGDTVLIPAGSFRLSGSIRPKNGTKLDGAGTLTGTASRFIDLSGRSNVEIAGITIDADSSTPNEAVLASGATALNIHDVTIRDFTRSSGFGPFGIYFSSNVTNSKISRVNVSNIGVNSKWGGGVRMNGGSNGNSVLDSTFTNLGRGGIFGDGSTDLTVRGNNVSGSGKYSGSGGAPLDIEVWGGSDRSIIENNTVDHWISVDQSDMTAVRRNTIRSVPPANSFAGLELVSSNDTIWTNNRVGRGAHVGISVSNTPGSSRAYFAHNVVDGAETFGAQLQGDGPITRFYFWDNTITHTNIQSPNLYRDAGNGMRLNGGVTHTTFEANRFSANNVNGVQFTGSGIDSLSFVRNEIIGNDDASIDQFSGSNIEWSGNTVSGNGTNHMLASKGFTGNPKPTIVLVRPMAIQAGVPANFSFTFADNGSFGHALWDFDEGLPQVGRNVSHTFATAGTYELGLIVWDDSGRGSRISTSLVVGPPSDLNSDGAVDAADYVVWRKSGAGQGAYENWRDNFGQSTVSTTGDFNADGIINAADYVVWRKTGAGLGDYDKWRRHFGQSMVSTAGDFNTDGAVTAADYVAWRKKDGTATGYNSWRTNFGQPAAGGVGRSSVPEPATPLQLALVVFASATFASRAWVASRREVC